MRERQVGGSQLTKQLINQTTFRIHVTGEKQTQFKHLLIVRVKPLAAHVTSAAPVV